jgi:DNA 3'-phosphatase
MWKEVESVLYYIHPDFKFNKPLAIFNFIDTLVFLKKNFTDIKLTYKYKCVKSKLMEITENGASIIVFQSLNIPKDNLYSSLSLDHIKELFDLFIIDIDIPIVAFFSTEKNKYMKPFTNIWKIIEIFYLKQNRKIEKKISIMVGHKAGRLNIHNKKKLDISCLDRAFALNIGLTFFTPERFFLNDKTVNLWQFNTNFINQNDRNVLLQNNNIQTPIIIDEINAMPKSDTYIILITGPPSCGKTTLANQLKKKWDLEYKMGIIEYLSENINELLDIDDTQISKEQHFEELQKSIDSKLKERKSIIIDLKCNFFLITKIIKTAMTNNTPILIIELKIDKKLIKLLDFIKIQKEKSHKNTLQTQYQWNTYYKNYKEPIYKELKCVRYIEFPLIIKLCDEYWYEYSY